MSLLRFGDAWGQSWKGSRVVWGLVGYDKAYSIPHTPVHPLQEHPQAAQNPMGDIRECLILLFPLSPLPSNTKLAQNVLLLPEPISGSGISSLVITPAGWILWAMTPWLRYAAEPWLTSGKQWGQNQDESIRWSSSIESGNRAREETSTKRLNLRGWKTGTRR